ncbi:winged helix-turn-helix transcriptional regulator [Candidatus Roizmanbacteria bacterium]|nr:winged helix-turn-helix transcriptional regulator [Candidatus Roizmanbacteria bacterium]
MKVLYYSYMVFFHKEICLTCLKTLSISSRMLIFQFLKNEGKLITIAGLVKYLNLRQPTVSFHIEKMTQAGIVRKIRRGKHTFCRIFKKCADCPLFS